MRIISGIYKGRRIMAPKKLPVRPTTDMAKESLFNILRNSYQFSKINVLDLFAGTGNISYEFASRGCSDITAVDSDLGCVRFISKIAEDLEMPINVQKSDVYRFLKQHVGTYDIIFADPPYHLPQESFETIASEVFNNNLLKETGTLIIEHSKHTSLNTLQFFKETRKYGGNAFSFFMK